MREQRSDTFHASFDEAFGALELPSGPERRRGASAAAGEVLKELATDVHAIDALRRDGAHDDTESTQALGELAVEITSLLYATGAPDVHWRRWAALAAEGLELDKRPEQALPYAVLGGRRGSLAALASPARTVSEIVLRNLVSGSATRPEPESHTNPAQDAWWTLADSIPGRQHDRTERALQCLADYWMGEDEAWEIFHPRQVNLYPSESAVAAWARRHGYRPSGLSARALRFLHAGLTGGDPTSDQP